VSVAAISLRRLCVRLAFCLKVSTKLGQGLASRLAEIEHTDCSIEVL
jgi:hypothetical protein